MDINTVVSWLFDCILVHLMDINAVVSWLFDCIYVQLMDMNENDEVETCGYRDMYAFAYRRKLKCSLKNGLFFSFFKRKGKSTLVVASWLLMDINTVVSWLFDCI